MSSFKSGLKKAAASAAVVVSVLVGSVVFAAPASAAPSNCNAYVATDGRGYGRCTSGSGEYRVAIACKGWINLGYGFTQYGNWAVPSGVYMSVAKCPTGSWNWAPNGGAFQAWVEKR